MLTYLQYAPLLRALRLVTNKNPNDEILSMVALGSRPRIGLFGGSFDPLHLGHEALVKAALELLRLDQVWVIPAGSPVHRQLSGQADAVTRKAWAEAVFSGLPNVEVKDWEIGSNQPVAAIDTLKRFRAKYPGMVPLWLCGADSFATMESWVGYPEHQYQCDVAVFSRVGEPKTEPLPGWKVMTVKQWNAGQGDEIGAGHFISLDGTLPDVSATMIRDRVLQGESLCELVNSRICKEVEALYGPESGERI